MSRVEALLVEHKLTGEEIRRLENKKVEIFKEIKRVCKHEVWTELEPSPFSNTRHKMCPYCKAIKVVEGKSD